MAVMLFGLGTMTTTAQDTPCAATGLTIGATTAADNSTATPDGVQASCWSDAAVEGDIWFSFIMPASGSANVLTTAGSNDDTQVAVYTSSTGDCSGTLTEVGCNDDISTTNYMSSADVCDLNAGDYCLIQVDGWQGTVGTFDILVTEIPPCTPPSCDASDCEAGSYVLAPPTAGICPDETTTMTTPSGMVIPADAECDASGALIFEPGPGATGGIDDTLTLFGVTFPYDFDRDLNGVLSANSLPVFGGTWYVRAAVYINFDGTVCDQTALTKEVTFYDIGEGPCDTAVACVAGTILNDAQTVCPGDSIDLTLSNGHDLPVPGDFYWFIDGITDTTLNYVYNFGNNPGFYQFVGDINALLIGSALPPLTPGDWLFTGANIDLTDTTICDITTNSAVITILDSLDAACGGTDCSAFDTAPVDLTKSFDPVGGVQDRVQVKWFKASPQVRYSDADAAMCDIKFWAKRNLDPVTGNPVGSAIVGPDTVNIVDAKKTYPGTTDPREIFKWPVKFRADGANNNKRAEPNIRYEWQVRCECGHDGNGPESPWSDVKIFNTPDFDTITGIYTPPPGEFFYEDIDTEEEVKSLNVVTRGAKLEIPSNLKKNNLGQLLLKKKMTRLTTKSILAPANIKLYPNPANDVLNIELDGEATYVRIMDMAGRVIHQERGLGNMLRLDISNLAEGMYSLELGVNGSVSHTPFIVKK